MAEVLEKENLQPTSEKRRIVEMDIIRGFALFGVLLVNLTMMGGAKINTNLDVWVWRFIQYLAEGKFYTIFSFLFGLGFYFFMHKSVSLGSTRHEKRFIRRLFSLLFFGLLHFIFIWTGDILLTYALVGFLLLRKYQRTNASLKKNIIVLLVFSTLIIGLAMGSFYDYDIKSNSEDYEHYMNKVEIYSEGSFLEAAAYRLTNKLAESILGSIIILPKFLALFYIGYSVGKNRIFQLLDQYKTSIVKLLKISGLLFLLTLISMYLLEIMMTNNFQLIYGFTFGILYEISTLLGSCFYICILLFIMKDQHIPKILMPLRSIGQMALTNYLAQTIFWSFVIHGYGLGYYNQIPMTFIPLLAVLFFSVQIVLSQWWLKNHKFGPMEKLWRKMTYGKQ
jgi:uncharacterized protein